MLFSFADEALANTLASALRDDGWAVAQVAVASETAARIGSRRPALIVVDGTNPSGAAAMLTEPDRVGRTIPVIALMPAGMAQGARRIDDCIDDRIEARTPAALVAAVRPWRPGDLLAGARRLEAAFGRAPIRAMIAGFREQLAEAVDRLDRTGDAGLAHRIAGLAGTLGFAAVSDRWLALSEGDAAAWGDARREARMALAAIDRECEA